MAMRAFIDDLRRLSFLIGLLVAVATAVWAGTYWGWWAYMWDIALPVRIVGVLAISTSAFFLWYAILFSAHYYLGKPERNPLIAPTRAGVLFDSDVVERLPIRVFETFDTDTLTVMVTNDGPTECFAAEIKYLSGAGVQGVETVWIPRCARWKGTDAEKREIIKGHSRELEIIKVTHVKADGHPPEGRFTVGAITLLGPSGDSLLSPNWIADSRITETIIIFLRVSSAESGIGNEYELAVNIATDGHRAPHKTVFLRRTH